jgi:hypothetical protein
LTLALPLMRSKNGNRDDDEQVDGQKDADRYRDRPRDTNHEVVDDATVIRMGQGVSMATATECTPLW